MERRKGVGGQAKRDDYCLYRGAHDVETHPGLPPPAPCLPFAVESKYFSMYLKPLLFLNCTLLIVCLDMIRIRSRLSIQISSNVFKIALVFEFHLVACMLGYDTDTITVEYPNIIQCI